MGVLHGICWVYHPENCSTHHEVARAAEDARQIGADDGGGKESSSKGPLDAKEIFASL
jgi:hypothetical protein